MNRRSLLKPPKKCTKIVRVSKYERNSRETEEWWRKRFRELEYVKSIPFYKKLRYLKECFSTHLLNELIEIGIDVYQENNENIVDLLIVESQVLKLAQSKVTPEKRVKYCEREQKYANPYLKFMSEPPNKVQVWRLKRKKNIVEKAHVIKKKELFDEVVVEEIEKMDLLQKAQEMEETLAAQYEDWFNRQGLPRVTRKTILAIFQTLYKGQMSKFFKRIIRVHGAVPATTAVFTDSFQHSEEVCFLNEVQKDISRSIGKPKTVAFGKCLPKELRRKPTEENLVEKWFSYDRKGLEDLATMAAVWKGITHLKSTRSFCAWLADHPDITPPIYLKEEGLMEECNYNKSVSEDIEDIIFDTSVVNIIPIHAFDDVAKSIKNKYI